MMIPFYNPSLQKVYCPNQVLFMPADSLFLKDHRPLQVAMCLYSCFFLCVKNTNLTSSGGMDNPRLYSKSLKMLKSLKAGNTQSW